ncbi:mitochondrial carrier domain-containing protein [Halenospora varia]|nr:mitochondrial carrier domain-containing protein [Halenospora varia]
MAAKQHNKNTVGQTILAGGVAGGLESLITFPTEYIKTQQQLLKAPRGHKVSPFRLLIDTIRYKGVQQLYGGATAFCISNASKSAVRFFVFDFTRQYFPQNAQNKTTPIGNLLSGLVAGVAESLIVVTPGETLKTKLIDDRNRQGGPKYKGTVSAIRNILAVEGIPGLYRGALPVTIKQSSNAVVRFTSYNMLLDQMRAITGESYAGATSMVAGGGAGIITVYCTMPMDNVKTRLQAIGGRERYFGTWNCLSSMVRQEGISSLWKGTTPRLLRLTVSGVISFAVYEQVILWTRPSLALSVPTIPKMI